MKKSFFIIFVCSCLFLINNSATASQVCFDTIDNKRYCYPYDCSFIGTLKNREARQGALFSEAKRKCTFRGAGETVRDATNGLLEGGNKIIDKLGVGEFFKGWSKK